MKKIIHRLEGIDAEAVGRASGFIRRTCRKLDVALLCKALAGLAGMGTMTLEAIVQTLGLLGHPAYSAQALCKRVGPGLEAFLLSVIATVFRRQTNITLLQGCFAPFQRVLIHDSTTISLPDRYAAAFPGCTNQSSRTFSQLKLQCVFDLVNLSLAQFSFSGYTRNDQAAAPDILVIARRGDLILRDMGYFTIRLLADMISANIHFLTRLHSSTRIYEPHRDTPIHLARVLKKGQRMDRLVCLGEERLLVRLVAIPVPQEVADQRRRQVRRYYRLNPSRDRLFLMNWNIFITTVDANTWSTKQVADVYRLRWTIEIIFKAWKSHLRLEELNTHSLAMLRLSIVTQLFHCTLMLWCWAELQTSAGCNGHASILRVARVVSQCTALIACMIFDLNPTQMFEGFLVRLSKHKPRKDRKNLPEQMVNLCASLG